MFKLIFNRFELLNFLKFGVTGIAVTLIYFFLAVTLVEVSALSSLLSNVIAFIVSTAMSYLINSMWSFGSPLGGVRLYRFIVVSIFCAFIVLTITIACDLIGAHYLYGVFAIVFVVPVISFIIHNKWTFR